MEIGIQRLRVVVGIDKVVAGVVRRIDVDGFDSAKVRFVEEFQHLKVIAFNEEVWGAVEVEGVSVARFQRRLGRRIEDTDGIALPCPREGVSFGCFIVIIYPPPFLLYWYIVIFAVSPGQLRLR